MVAKDTVELGPVQETTVAGFGLGGETDEEMLMNLPWQPRGRHIPGRGRTAHDTGGPERFAGRGALSGPDRLAELENG